MNYMPIKIDLPLIKEGGTEKLNSPDAVAQALPDAAKMAQEAFFVLTLNSNNILIDKHLVTLGLVNSSQAHPREVFRAAILDSAAAVILAHNHPSGNNNPSAEDVKITEQLCQAGKIIGIEVLDHVILAGNGFYSFKENGRI